MNGCAASLAASRQKRRGNDQREAGSSRKGRRRVDEDGERGEDRGREKDPARVGKPRTQPCVRG